MIVTNTPTQKLNAPQLHVFQNPQNLGKRDSSCVSVRVTRVELGRLFRKEVKWEKANGKGVSFRAETGGDKREGWHGDGLK